MLELSIVSVCLSPSLYHLYLPLPLFLSIFLPPPNFLSLYLSLLLYIYIYIHVHMRICAYVHVCTMTYTNIFVWSLLRPHNMFHSYLCFIDVPCLGGMQLAYLLIGVLRSMPFL